MSDLYLDDLTAHDQYSYVAHKRDAAVEGVARFVRSSTHSDGRYELRVHVSRRFATRGAMGARQRERAELFRDLCRAALIEAALTAGWEARTVRELGTEVERWYHPDYQTPEAPSSASLTYEDVRALHTAGTLVGTLLILTPEELASAATAVSAVVGCSMHEVLGVFGQLIDRATETASAIAYLGKLLSPALSAYEQEAINAICTPPAVPCENCGQKPIRCTCDAPSPPALTSCRIQLPDGSWLGLDGQGRRVELAQIARVA